MDGPLYVEDALIASLAGLRLGQVSSLEGDWFYFPDGYQDLLRGHQLRTVLGNKQRASVWSVLAHTSLLPKPRWWTGLPCQVIASCIQAGCPQGCTSIKGHMESAGNIKSIS